MKKSPFKSVWMMKSRPSSKRSSTKNVVLKAPTEPTTATPRSPSRSRSLNLASTKPPPSSTKPSSQTNSCVTRSTVCVVRKWYLTTSTSVWSKSFRKSVRTWRGSLKWPTRHMRRGIRRRRSWHCWWSRWRGRGHWRVGSCWRRCRKERQCRRLRMSSRAQWGMR